MIALRDGSAGPALRLDGRQSHGAGPSVEAVRNAESAKRPTTELSRAKLLPERSRFRIFSRGVCGYLVATYVGDIPSQKTPKLRRAQYRFSNSAGKRAPLDWKNSTTLSRAFFVACSAASQYPAVEQSFCTHCRGTIHAVLRRLTTPRAYVPRLAMLHQTKGGVRCVGLGLAQRLQCLSCPE